MDDQKSLVLGEKSLSNQANSDRQLIEIWLHGRAKTTILAYAYEAKRLLTFLDGQPLQSVTLPDLQAYASSLVHLSSATQTRSINSIKSLFSFGQKIGYLQWNVAVPLKSPAVKNMLAERIMSEADVQQICKLETLNPRDRLIVRLLYVGALRVSELCDLKWRDLQPRGTTGQVTVFGKGGKTGVVLLPQAIWDELKQLPGRLPDSPVFCSQRKGHLSATQVWRIVKGASEAIGLEASPHWFRHSHASHALDHGAPISLVQQTLRHSNVATTSRYLHVRPNESSSNFLNL